jgi:hypothetical protein
MTDILYSDRSKAAIIDKALLSSDGVWEMLGSAIFTPSINTTRPSAPSRLESGYYLINKVPYMFLLNFIP